MTTFIILFGALTLLAGIVILVNPEIIFGFLSKHGEKTGLQVLAIAVRLVLGALLVYQSDASRYPLVIEVIGWLAIVAAVIFSVIGRRNFRRLMSWALSLTKPLGRAGGFIAAAFGAFLIYAFVYKSDGNLFDLVDAHQKDDDHASRLQPRGSIHIKGRGFDFERIQCV